MVDKQALIEQLDGSEIAIIGMACRFPGADSPEAFWENLRAGVESITTLSEAELLAAGVDPAELRDPRYVRAAPLLDEIEGFDAAFFGYTPMEAAIMDPQQRLFLECAWSALEAAGYDPESYAGAIGMYGGAKTNTYLFSLASNPALVKSFDFLQLVLGGDLAMLSTRISYKLNLKGPSYAVQTACSTSLVAIHLACQSLLINECKMALAGAVAINVPHRVGYLAQEGGIMSPDGHCRAFDAEAAGTLFGSGVGFVVLKRLEDAINDGDTIQAVIRGTATNNDGAIKASFTAPSVEGQANVILEALAIANVPADSISYVEAHGTGTALGDPIEILALTEAYRASTDAQQFCAIGSVKTNVGHLDAAAGMSSLIKTVMALKHAELPPSLHYTTPNPKIDFAGSPFFVNTELRPWAQGDGPRRAGVSSFGFGGTNAHLILEEAPRLPLTDPAQPWQLLVLSARTPTALDTLTAHLHNHLASTPDLNLADVSYTLQVGRKALPQRRIVVVHDQADAVAALAAASSERWIDSVQNTRNRPVAWMFSGQGAQYVGMGHGLYQSEPVFRAAVDRCAAVLQPLLGLDLRTVVFATGDQTEASAQLQQTALAQPALFVIEYSLAQLWQSWGIVPAALIGHSIGEYVAACLAGVFSLEDALSLVATRGKLMQQMPAGSMLAVALPETEVLSLLTPELSLAAVNGPQQCVVAGPSQAIAALAATLQARGTNHRALHTSHAFHSAMMEPILAEFEAAVRRVKLQAPQQRVISNVSGQWLTAAEATDPRYWARHLRQPVRFAAGLTTLLGEAEAVLLEVGPGTTLATFARQQPQATTVLASLRHPNDQRPDRAFVLTTLGQLWLAGIDPQWPTLHTPNRQRLPLPTYPFEHQRYWIDSEPIAPTQRHFTLDKLPDLADWIYQPSWQQAILPASSGTAQPGTFLVLLDQLGLGQQLAEALSAAQQTVILVRAGTSFARTGLTSYTINPSNKADYDALLDNVVRQGITPQSIVHMWNVSTAATELADDETASFYSLLFLAQACGKQLDLGPTRLLIVSNNVHAVTGNETLEPIKATLLGPCRVVPKEYPQITCRNLDLVLDETANLGAASALLVAEILSTATSEVVAFRDGLRWEQQYAPLHLAASSTPPARLRQHGVYVITGGLGGIGLVLAEYLARTVQAKLVLTGRSGLPPRADWAAWCALHPTTDPTSQKIAAIERLEERGAEVLVVAADVTDQAAMASAWQAATERWGTVNGVIHAAGIAGGGVIQMKTAAQARQVLDPKIIGTQVLAELSRTTPLDFMVLCASLQTVMGDLGQVDYAAANAFMDAFAHQASRQGQPVIAIDWDNWQEVGIAASTAIPDNLQALRAELLAKALTSAEGVEIFERVLAAPTPQVVISTQPLIERIELAKQATSSGLFDARPATPSKASGTTRKPAASQGALEQQIAAVWQRVLGIPSVGLHDNFFDLGGNSLTGMQLLNELNRELDVQLAPVALFEAPTVSALARQLAPAPATAATKAAPAAQATATTEIAIIGMAGRFPGADSVDEFWANLAAGVESITFFSDEELAAERIPDELLRDPRYVKARPILHDVEGFDAGLFGYTPREAELMDPQHRVLMECAWAALEDAGYGADTFPGAVGVYAGASMSTYLLNLYTDPQLVQSVNPTQAVIGNDQDSLTTSISYKLNLKGPSLTVQTFCSTSLVAVHLACQSLLRGECGLALAGGVSIFVPQHSGYHYQDDGIVSPDGHCRTFDAQAQGTLFGNGVGLVVLKPLADAQRDGDTIQAVIRGTAINNDGALKVGYTAPSVEGQAAVIAQALAVAGISADTIGYVEAHGTGTALGDPIEVAALTKAFRATTDARQFCAIGSVKTNIGHLDRAAGIAALIKTVQTIKHGVIPPTLHYTTPNPKIDFANSPFYVNAELTPWSAENGPRRAGVSSLGFGGTNAHVIIEQAPAPLVESAPAAAGQLLVLSAKTPTALEAQTAQLANYLAAQPALNLADVALTLQAGRKALTYRRAVVAHDAADAIAALNAPERQLDAVQETRTAPLVWLFSGQGAQYVGMGRELYQSEPLFRSTVDRCAALLEPHLGLDLRTIVFATGDQAQAAAQLQQTSLTQPALFVIEYSLAQLWQSWGIMPTALIGHSIGEYVAACVAGVFSLEDALTLVATRGKLMQQMPAGSMLAVTLPEAEVETLLTPELSLAAVNGPQQCVVAGPSSAIETLATILQARDVPHRRLHTSHAFHSAMMEPILSDFQAAVAEVALHAPQLPVVSNISGQWLTAAEATDPAYWARHLRQAVRFAAGMQTATQQPNTIVLEVGPGRTLATLARQSVPGLAPQQVLSSLPGAQDSSGDRATWLRTLGQLWLLGLPIDWRAGHQEPRRRVALPTYPFEHQRYWLTPQAPTYAAPQRRIDTSKQPDLANWFYLPTWQRASLPSQAEAGESRHWLVWSDQAGLSSALLERLKRDGHTVNEVRAGSHYAVLAPGVWQIDPAASADYQTLVRDLVATGPLPTQIVHAWSITNDLAPLGTESFSAAQSLGFYSLLFWLQALSSQALSTPIQLDLLANNLHSLHLAEYAAPAKATLIGLSKVIPQEYPGVTVRSLDVALPQAGHKQLAKLADLVLAELYRAPTDLTVAYRGSQRWLPGFEQQRLAAPSAPVLRAGGVYALTGGLAEIGYALAETLASQAQPQLVLIEETALPARAEWETWRQTHAEQDAISQKMRQVEHLESLGAQVTLEAVALGDAAALTALFDRWTAQHQPINGVIYAAGIVGEQAFRGMQDLSVAECEAHWARKVHGLHVWEAVLAERELDFCVVNSSISVWLGGRGYAAYAAANSFVDAFVRLHNQHSDQLWISINWDAWQLDKLLTISQSLAQLAMTTEEGGAALQRIIAAGPSEPLLVSTSDLPSRIEQGLKNLEVMRTGGAALRSDPAAPRHPRPKLATPFVAATSEFEQTIADVWAQALGFEQIGLHDNFFELGGDSLIAIQVVARLKDALHIEVSVVSLYEALTVEGLAKTLQAEQQPAGDQFAEREVRTSRRNQLRQAKQARKRERRSDQTDWDDETDDISISSI